MVACEVAGRYPHRSAGGIDRAAAGGRRVACKGTTGDGGGGILAFRRHGAANGDGAAFRSDGAAVIPRLVAGEGAAVDEHERSRRADRAAVTVDGLVLLDLYSIADGDGTARQVERAAVGGGSVALHQGAAGDLQGAVARIVDGAALAGLVAGECASHGRVPILGPCLVLDCNVARGSIDRAAVPGLVAAENGALYRNGPASVVKDGCAVAGEIMCVHQHRAHADGQRTAVVFDHRAAGVHLVSVQGHALQDQCASVQEHGRLSKRGVARDGRGGSITGGIGRHIRMILVAPSRRFQRHGIAVGDHDGVGGGHDVVTDHLDRDRRHVTVEGILRGRVQGIEGLPADFADRLHVALVFDRDRSGRSRRVNNISVLKGRIQGLQHIIPVLVTFCVIFLQGADGGLPIDVVSQDDAGLHAFKPGIRVSQQILHLAS